MTTFTTPLNQIESLYVGYFGRAGDPAGVNYWVSQLNAGVTTLAQIAASFSVQPEATARYSYLANPNISDPGAFVDQVYQNMFNHTADAAGKAYWMEQLTAAQGNPSAIGAMILNIISGATGADSTTITNKVDVAADFTTKATNAGTTWNASASAQSAAEISATNDTAASVTAQKAATDAYIASAPGPQSNFTLGIDSLTANTLNANFNAPMIFNAPTGTLVQSLQSGDSAIDTAPLTGPGLSNGGLFTGTLDGLAPNVIMRNIPTHSVTNVGGGIAGYSGAITGLTSIINNNSIGGLTIGALGAGIDKGGIAGTTTTGATLLNSVIANNTATGATTVFVNSAALSGSSDGLRINTTGAFGTGLAPNTISVKNDAAAVGAVMNGYETLDINAGGATFLRLADATSGIASTTTITVTGAGATTLFGEATEAHFTKLTTIDGSTQTGGLTITGASTAGGLLAGNTVLSSFKGGTGADSIDLSAMTAAQLGAITPTNLDGGTSRDTLILSTAAAATTEAINNSNFETLGLLGGTLTMDFSKFGAGIDTIRLSAAQTATDTFNNLASGLTFALGSFHGGFAETFNVAGTGLSDTLAVNFTGAAAVGKFTTTGFENVTTTLANFAGAVGWGGLSGTATAGATVTHNLISNQTGGALTISGENLGAGGSLIIIGSATGSNIFFSTAPVLSALNASAWGTGLAASTAGITYGTFATSGQSFLGSAGADFFLGSVFADTVNGGAGNDILVNMAPFAGGVGVNDQITTGTGVDQVALRGDNPSGVLPALYGAASVILDMTVGTGAVGTTDFITLSIGAANYLVGGTSNGSTGLGVAVQGQGTWEVQGVNAATGAVAITNAASELIKFTTGVAAGATLQATFNAAIGTTLISGATADKAYFFTLYDTTNSKMILGLVNDHNGDTTKIETGDVVSLVSTVNMSAADYDNIGNKHFSVI